MQKNIFLKYKNHFLGTLIVELMLRLKKFRRVIKFQKIDSEKTQEQVSIYRQSVEGLK